MNRLATVAACLLAALTGCATPPDGAPEPEASDVTPSGTPVTASPPTPPTITVNTSTLPPSPTGPPDSAVAKLGQWWRFDDGLRARIASVVTYKVGPHVYGARPGSPGLMVTVTLQNGGSQALKTDWTRVLLTYGPNGEQATEVFDGKEKAFTGVLPPKENRTAKYGFSVPVKHLRAPVTVEVIPSFEHGSALFRGAAAK